MTRDLPHAAKAASAWGMPVPEWVSELARLADREGLAGAGKRIGYSPSLVSNVIGNRYAGDVDRVEQVVRGALMAETVDCPVIGEIGRDRCLDEQQQPFRATSAMRAQLFQACKTCVHRRVKEPR